LSGVDSHRGFFCGLIRGPVCFAISSWTLQARLEELDFADDICMLFHRYQDMQHQATSLEEIAKQTGPLINPQKKPR
jgi:hypothetical protein